MSLEQVRAALERLCKPEWPEQWIKREEGFIKNLYRPLELIELFVSLVAAFVAALKAVGADKVLHQREALFDKLTGEGSDFEKARKAAQNEVCKALEPHRSADGSFPSEGAPKQRGKISLNGRSPRASGWELIADQYWNVEKLLGDKDHMLWHLSDAYQFANRLVSIPGSGPEASVLNRWRDELFKVWTRENNEHLLGCQLIMRCLAVEDEQHIDHDERKRLLKFMIKHAPQTVRIIKAAARSLLESAIAQSGSNQHTDDNLSESPLSAQGQETPITIQDNNDPFVFRANGEYWQVRYGANTEMKLVKDNIGMRYICKLLANQNCELGVKELISLARNPEANTERMLTPPEYPDYYKQRQDYRDPIGVFPPSKKYMPCFQKPQPTFEEDAIVDIKKAITRLNEEMELAKKLGQTTKYNELELDKLEIEAHFKNGLSLKGKPRPLNSNQEKARQSVKRAISRACEGLERIGLTDLATHLKKSIRTGNTCAYYTGDKLIPWKVE